MGCRHKVQKVKQGKICLPQCVYFRQRFRVLDISGLSAFKQQNKIIKGNSKSLNKMDNLFFSQFF